MKKITVPKKCYRRGSLNALCAAGMALLCAGAMLAWPRTTSARAATAGAPTARANQSQSKQIDPWTSAETVSPAELAKEIKRPAKERPTVVSVSPHALYLGGHVPGAVYEGPGRTPQGIARLEQWAERLPRSTNLVVYCGCCPLVHCPNLRPAFRALKSMGFTHLRALILTTNFYKDWYSKGYASEKGE